MADAKKMSVGLIILTDVPSMGRVAILQRRGEFNHEKMGPESYPGGCRVTAHGKCEVGESFCKAIDREIVEELGLAAAGLIRHEDALLHDDEGKSIYQEIIKVEGEEKVVLTYGVVLPSKYLFGGIQLGPSSGGLVLVHEDQVDNIQDLTKFDKKEGVTDRRVIAMFPDEKEAVKKAFEMFK